MKNLLTDIPGVRVGHADDAALASGVTAIVFDRPAVASIDVRGGGPGTRECALLDPVSTVETIKAGSWDTILGKMEFDAKGDIKQLDYVVYKWDAKGNYTQINTKGS